MWHGLEVELYKRAEWKRCTKLIKSKSLSNQHKAQQTKYQLLVSQLKISATCTILKQFIIMTKDNEPMAQFKKSFPKLSITFCLYTWMNNKIDTCS